MGKFEFELPDALPGNLQSALMRSWLCGSYDGQPVPTRRKSEPHRIIFTREESDSSYLQCPWYSDQFEHVVSTATLREQKQTYQLGIELCRGSVNRLRGLIHELQGLDVSLPEILLQKVHQVTMRFGRIVLADPPISSAEVMSILNETHLLIDTAVSLFGDHRLKFRKSQNGIPLPLWWGARVIAPMSEEECLAYTKTFNAIRIVPNWAQIEAQEANYDWSHLDQLVMWASTMGLGVSMGPLIDLDAPLPAWLLEWQGDLPSLTAFMSDFLGTIVSRYRQQIRVWQVFTGLNYTDQFHLEEDDRIRLAARLLEEARQIDREAVWIIGLRQPWGDYLASDQQTYSPVIFVDTLLRAGYNLGGLELEMSFNGTARCSHRRDPLDIVQLVELFDQLSIPLELCYSDDRYPQAPVQLPTGLVSAASSSSVQAAYWNCWATPKDDTTKTTQALWETGSLDLLTPFRTFREQWLR
jgi:hypothetical protein